LKEIEKDIHLRNSTCNTGYKYEALLPSFISQSINVLSLPAYHLSHFIIALCDA